MSIIKISIITDEFYFNNRFFDELDLLSNRDDCLRPWIELKKSLLHNNVSIDTIDVTPISEAEIVIFLNVPDENNPFYVESTSLNKIKFCVITELEYIHKNNARLDLINKFDIVFTYQTNLVNNRNIFKLNYSFDFERIVNNFRKVPFSRRKLMASLIAGNKFLNHKNELYSTRVKIINWFKNNHPLQLDLYGFGWNQKVVFRKFLFKFKYLLWFKSFIPSYYNSYKGTIESKSKTLQMYRFSFTIENAIDVPGWITEKIFDPLFNGCIPIYLGASEISEHVDASCFIDLRQFKSLENLYEYIEQIDELKFQEYQNNILKFLEEKAKEKNYEFGVPYFVKTIEKQIFKFIKL